MKKKIVKLDYGKSKNRLKQAGTYNITHFTSNLNMVNSF